MQNSICLTIRTVQEPGDDKVASSVPLQEEEGYFAPWGIKHLFLYHTAFCFYPEMTRIEALNV